jgi:hypothetical protein
MSNVHNYALERASRETNDLSLVDDDLADMASDEMAEALARVAPIAEPAPVVAIPADVSPLLAQWLKFRPQFADAMEGGFYSVEGLEAEILNGEAYFWPAENAAVVAKRVDMGGEVVMQTLWAVGDLAEVLTLEPGIAATARIVGCSSVLVEGRAGWTKLLKPMGYEPWSVTVRKAL